MIGEGRLQNGVHRRIGAKGIAAALVLWAAQSGAMSTQHHSQAAAAHASEEPEDGDRRTVEMFAEVQDSVVCIRTLGRHHDDVTGELHEMERGGGSGFVWDRQGHVVTNYHVLEGADGAEVTFADGSVERARLVGGDAATDLAVLRIDGPREGLRPIPAAPAAGPRVGQSVYAVGNPFSLGHTLTHGIVSGVGREIEGPSGATISGIVQTDAAINPGNSGGPLLDVRGRLVGVNSALFGSSGDSAGLGFAIPAAIVGRIVPALIRDGRIRRPSLGVELAPDGLARALGLRGALVLAVAEGSDADGLGLIATLREPDGHWRPGDLIEVFAGTPVRSAGELLRALEARLPGESIAVELYRAGERRTVFLTLAEATATPALAVPSDRK